MLTSRTSFVLTNAAYLASSTVSAGYRSPLTRSRLCRRVAHLLRLVRRSVHLRRRGQCAVLVGMLGLHGRHDGRALRNGLRDWSHLVLRMRVSAICGKRWIDRTHHGCCK